MDILLEGLLEYHYSYFDNILVTGATLEEHLSTPEKILCCLECLDLIQEEKVSAHGFCSHVYSFLGHALSADHKPLLGLLSDTKKSHLRLQPEYIVGHCLMMREYTLNFWNTTSNGSSDAHSWLPADSTNQCWDTFAISVVNWLFREFTSVQGRERSSGSPRWYSFNSKAGLVIVILWRCLFHKNRQNSYLLYKSCILWRARVILPKPERMADGTAWRTSGNMPHESTCMNVCHVTMYNFWHWRAGRRMFGGSKE